MIHFHYEFLVCVVDAVEHHGLKITFCRNVEEYLFPFLANNPSFFGILASEKPTFLPPVIAAAISSMVFFDDAP